MGESTAALAAAEPEIDHLAVEVFEPGIAALLMRAEAAELTNLSSCAGTPSRCCPTGCPRRRWPGSGSSSRTRGPSAATTSAGSCNPVRGARGTRLRPGGTLHMATDWADYAEQMRAVADAEPLLWAERRRVPRGGR